MRDDPLHLPFLILAIFKHSRDLPARGLELSTVAVCKRGSIKGAKKYKEEIELSNSYT